MNLIDQIVNHIELHDLKGINKCFEKGLVKAKC